MKILHSADLHINLHKKKVPYTWAENRFKSFFTKMLELESSHDIHIISGDIFDKKPEPDEICLFLSYINSVKIPTFIIPGNHEATQKGKSFLEFFCDDNTIINDNIHIFVYNKKVTVNGQKFYFFPYGEIQINNLSEHEDGEILVTHIRGEVPPHVTAEYDFEKLRPWKLILLGDIHFAHKYKDFPAYYSGSPMNTTFDRDSKKQYGINSIELRSIDDYTVNFIDLKLPKLIRQTLQVGKEMTENAYDHIIYEITGSIDELSKVKNNKLLDKKIAIRNSSKSKLELKDMSIIDELSSWLTYSGVKDAEKVLNEWKDADIK